MEEHMESNITRPLAGRISVWIQERVREARAKGLVFGMSGGVDSSVVAALARMACGDKVLGMIMPCHSDPRSAEDATKVARKLGIKTHVADLTASYDMLIARIPHAEGIELTNVRPRLRMTALYCAAQAMNYLVIGTGNKTERLIGYFTKWGDGACDIQPIANLYKFQVYGLARELEIPEDIIAKPPTADLWEGQTDENEIGLSYAELDTVLQGIECGEISTLNPVSVERVRKMMAASEHKRCPVPMFGP
jgi:NAD+ synthase